MAEATLDKVRMMWRRLHLCTAIAAAIIITPFGAVLYPTAALSQHVLRTGVVAKSSKTPKTDCPAALVNATRLIAITTNKLSDTTATARLYRRAAPTKPWQANGKAFGAVVGRGGLAWGYTHRDLAKPGEKLKREGDKRTPAGVFAAGIPFGLASRPLANYLKLRKGVVCIDDPRSKKYSAILKSGAPAGVSHEKMWRIKGYKYGLVVRTPASGAVRSGSCIFLHVWRSSSRPTVGCVAFSAPQMKRIQSAFQNQVSAVAILPRHAHKRLSKCGLPSS